MAERFPAVAAIWRGKLPVGVVMPVLTLIVADVGVYETTVAMANGGRLFTAKVMVELNPPLGEMATL